MCPRGFSPQMDAPTHCYPTFPQPPPTRARCPKSLPRLATPALVRSCGIVRDETPEISITTVRNSDDDVGRTSSNCVASFSSFLSSGSTVIRVTTTGNHPSPTTANAALLTEIGDVRSAPLRNHPSVFLDQVLTCIAQGSAPRPVSIWAVKSGHAARDERDRSSLFCIYRTHEEVSIISPFTQMSGEKEAITFPVLPHEVLSAQPHLSHRNACRVFFIDLTETV